MDKLKNNYKDCTIRFTKPPDNNGASQETLLSQSQSVSSDPNIKRFEDSYMRKYFKKYLPYAQPTYLAIKFIGMLIMFILGTYVLWQCTIYFKEAKVQQEKIHFELDNFRIAAEQKLKQMNILQHIIEDKIENIDVLTEESSKRIKDLFTFSKSDLLKDTVEENSGEQCEFIPLNLRFDCHPEDEPSQLSCTQRGCCWHPLHQLNYEKQVPLDVPYCYYPKNWSLYKYENFSKNSNDFSGFLRLQRNSFYKKDISLVKIEAIGIDDSTLRVKISDAQKKRYEPPYPVRSYPELFSKVSDNAQYEFKMDENVPGFKIIRINDKRNIFNSIGFGGFIFADQFLQISSILPSHNIYGLGEHRTNLKLNTNWQKLTLFNADQPPTENANLYGSHPFYMVVENTGKAHGVLFLNSNAMDVILQPTPAITFRSIGGIFDIYFFMGPTPADVLKQYSEVVGKPFLPPYWSLGFHLCRFGYGSLDNTKAVWQRTRDALIPFDTQWNDLDYMDKNNDFTYDKTKFKDLPNFIKELHNARMHYIPLIDAGISASEKNGTYIPYDEGVRRGVFVYDTYNNEPFKGKVWNLVSTTWPDFTNPATLDYYTEMMNNMYEGFAYDGAWIDMNEPSNFYNGHINGCENTNLDNPPYIPNINSHLLAKKTICMSAKHHLSYHYDLHNTYGTSQAVIVNHALKKIRNKRPFIISRSTWEGHGFYAGHWTGDVYSSWHDMRMSIPEILAYSLFQIPMVGADICGFDGNTTEALCNRWMQLGAFYPFSRNHNSDDTIEQDPVAMGQMVVMSSKKALNTRYYFLPYLYTLFYRAHIYGETVARPLFVEFNEDPKTFNIDTQFLWGSCIMIVPVLFEGKTNVEAYLPRGLWYNYYTMESSFSIGKNYTLDAPLDTIPLLVYGGCILPVQEPSVTTTLSRQKPFGLLIALDEFENAKGELYWDDGDSLDSIEKKQYKIFKFEVSNSMLTSNVSNGTFDGNMKLKNVIVMGIPKVVKQVFLNDKEVDFEYDKEKLTLKVENISLDFSMTFDLKWSDKQTERHLSTTAMPQHVEPTSHAYPTLQEMGAMSFAVSLSTTPIFMGFSLFIFFNSL
ncbi:lysosomal alpha-glucosidase-like isoform X1 [Phymastichus coffea]|uniref:lysosomal alpha-glucosidase-like isoform X1 n=1 Tax=Phymastichus coffea TaxID=108790 RepID=UPI00273AE4C2|nr:lysosomal alpha-glucosidase-like isoform X1 [Phymastichus coffea]XP_058803863.1 lysosomal alpha-glucosidase-like isoform X1 [Phymastichus coffea]